MIIKTLTLTQPWATLIAIGAKKIETRSWGTTHRGLLAIHAAKGVPEGLIEQDLIELCQRDPFDWALKQAGITSFSHLPRGAIVCVCELQNAVRMSNTYLPIEPERSFGMYEEGRYAWELGKIHRLPEPIPARGAQILWNWNAPDNLYPF